MWLLKGWYVNIKGILCAVGDYVSVLDGITPADTWRLLQVVFKRCARVSALLKESRHFMCFLLVIALHAAQTDPKELTVRNALQCSVESALSCDEDSYGVSWLVVYRGGYSFFWDAEFYVQEGEVSARFYLSTISVRVLCTTVYLFNDVSHSKLNLTLRRG